MKRLNLFQWAMLIALFFAACSKKEIDLKSVVQERINDSQINFIPDSAGITPSYWCTWGAQNFAKDTFTLNCVVGGIGGHNVPADNLTEEAVFHNPGWEKQFPGIIKKDLFLVYDVGWDIDGGSKDDHSKWILGTTELAEGKFPSCTGTFEERLTKLNALTKQAGWKGAGLWIASQTSLNSKVHKPSVNEEEVFFRERLKWSKAAGINYWKIDYGSRASDIKFREMLTRLAKEEAPELWVEHGRSGSPFNDEACPYDSTNYNRMGGFKNWDNGKPLQTTHELLEFSDVLRTYDVTPQLSIPTTLDRVAQILSSFTSKPNSKGIINCEDEPFIAAALGCAIGVMRHPGFIVAQGHDYDPLKTKNQMDAIIRAVRWQRMSPAFSVGTNETNLDSLANNDYWKFIPGQTWANWVNGKTILQAAPARVARGMQLPDVKCEGEKPYVICSKFPNGNYAISTQFRTDSIKGFVFPIADVTLFCTKVAPVGVFGNFKSLTLKFDAESPINQVFAQDLAGKKAIEITDLIEKEGASLKISGELLELVGLSSASDNDISEPGLVLIFK